MRSTILVSSLLLVTAAQGGTSTEDADSVAATLIECTVESNSDGSLRETCVGVTVNKWEERVRGRQTGLPQRKSPNFATAGAMATLQTTARGAV